MWVGLQTAILPCVDWGSPSKECPQEGHGLLRKGRRTVATQMPKDVVWLWSPCLTWPRAWAPDQFFQEKEKAAKQRQWLSVKVLPRTFLLVVEYTSRLDPHALWCACGGR